jgi:hypothetical protein
MWISPKFQLLLVREFQRLKADESDRLKLEWNLQRTLAKINYRIHTDAIKENLIPIALSKEKINFVYADEADLLNMSLLIHQGLSQSERLIQLNKVAIAQMKSLLGNTNFKKLK